jgi:hypothetical protein
VQTWQPKRQFFLPGGFMVVKKNFDADKTTLTTIETGVYYPNIGKSNQEIAALSRSSHQSQGFGSSGSRGEDSEYLELVNGDKLNNTSNIFEGIDTSWEVGGKPVGELINQIASKYDFSNPAASISDLTKVYVMIQSLDENHWKALKIKKLKKS